MTCSKDCKKLGVAALVAVVALYAMEFVFHGVLLQGVYHHYQGLWNPGPVMASRRWAMFLAYIVFGVFFTKIYTYGYEESRPSLGQGIRYGLWVGLMVYALGCCLEYMVYPISFKLAGVWFVGGVAETVVLGALVASLYKPRPEESH